MVALGIQILSTPTITGAKSSFHPPYPNPPVHPMDQPTHSVVCPQNSDLAAFMWNKRREIADSPKGLSETLDKTLTKAYNNVCNSGTSILSLKDLSLLKGVGKWILRQMQAYFERGSGSSEPEDLTIRGKKIKEAKRYAPQKNSVAYALLISLYRGTSNGAEFMHKQELIVAAEASGLSRVPIMAEKAKGKPPPFGSSPRDWYSGWSCMKTLIRKGLVVKSSCPAKYMLTVEGKEAARECHLRSGLPDSNENFDNLKGCSERDDIHASGLAISLGYSNMEVTQPFNGSFRQKKAIDVPVELLERFMKMGHSKEQVLNAFTKVSKECQDKEISSLWPAVLCHLLEDQVYNNLDLNSESVKENQDETSSPADLVGSKNRLDSSCVGRHISNSYPSDKDQTSFALRACSSSDNSFQKATTVDLEATLNILNMPPLSFGKRFEDVYDVVLVLDDREQFAIQGSRSRRIIDHIRSQFRIKIEVKRLPVGDAIWIARHREFGPEYVLDFIVERKKVDDLRSSIRDNRYKDQKSRLLRCGLKKLLYLVEGDPNSSDAAESIKTACFTTEILEGFDVQRTNGLGDTLRMYGYLTQAITQYYREASENHLKYAGHCPSLDEFFKRCQDLDKITVSDVFAIQLMQVSQVTEEVAIAVLDLYPTVLSLAHAYSLLDGDICAQEEMLKRQSNSVISAVASRNIFLFVWGSGQ